MAKRINFFQTNIWKKIQSKDIGSAKKCPKNIHFGQMVNTIYIQNLRSKSFVCKARQQNIILFGGFVAGTKNDVIMMSLKNKEFHSNVRKVILRTHRLFFSRNITD